MEATLFHAGVIDELPRKRAWTKADIRAAQWAKVPERMRTTMHTYLEQVGATLRPGRVKNIEATLREFAGFATEHDPSARCVADLAAASPVRRKRTASGEDAGVGGLRPKRARIADVGG